MKHIKITTLALMILLSSIANAQSTPADSLTLSTIITQILNNYPVLKKADQDLISADAKIGLTKTAYLPDILFSSSYSRIGPTTSISMPVNGTTRTFSLFPENVYSASLSVNENIYDFGKTAKNIVLDKKNKELIQITVEQAKQRISTAAMGNYYTISFLQEAIKIKNEQLKTLNEHLEFVQKKAASGSATQYDIMTTKVRISVIENQMTDIQTSLQIQMAQLNSLLGQPLENNLLLKNISLNQEIIPSLDSLNKIAYSNRNEMKMSLQKEEITKSRLGVIKVQNNPSFNFFASGGFKNGYLNEYLQDIGKLNFAVGVGFKVPVFDANRSKYLKMQVNSDLQANQEETELTRRNISNEVLENRANTLAALKKVKQSELQLKQALQAYNLAEISYQAGAITNLDLLDSYTAVSESKLMLYKTNIDYAVNLQKLKIAIGQKLY